MHMRTAWSPCRPNAAAAISSPPSWAICPTLSSLLAKFRSAAKAATATSRSPSKRRAQPMSSGMAFYARWVLVVRGTEGCLVDGDDDSGTVPS